MTDRTRELLEELYRTLNRSNQGMQGYDYKVMDQMVVTALWNVRKPRSLWTIGYTHAKPFHSSLPDTLGLLDVTQWQLVGYARLHGTPYWQAAIEHLDPKKPAFSMQGPTGCIAVLLCIVRALLWEIEEATKPA